VSPPLVVAPEISDFQQGGGKEQLGLSMSRDQRQVTWLGLCTLIRVELPWGLPGLVPRLRERGNCLFSGLLGIQMKFC